jgi:hypothetical protein
MERRLEKKPNTVVREEEERMEELKKREKTGLNNHLKERMKRKNQEIERERLANKEREVKHPVFPTESLFGMTVTDDGTIPTTSTEMTNQ